MHHSLLPLDLSVSDRSEDRSNVPEVTHRSSGLSPVCLPILGKHSATNLFAVMECEKRNPANRDGKALCGNLFPA